MIIYTAGYLSHSVMSLKLHAKRLNALVMDIRKSDNSHEGQWRGYALRQALGSRYISNAYWGNEHFKPEDRAKGVLLFDWEEGLRFFKTITGERQPDAVILLCACRSEMECHRYIVGKRLRDEGYTVKPFQWLKPTKKRPEAEPQPEQQAFFLP